MVALAALLVGAGVARSAPDGAPGQAVAAAAPASEAAATPASGAPGNDAPGQGPASSGASSAEAAPLEENASGETPPAGGSADVPTQGADNGPAVEAADQSASIADAPAESPGNGNGNGIGSGNGNGKSDDKAATDVTPGEGAPGHAGGQDDGSGSAPDDGAAPTDQSQPDGNGGNGNGIGSGNGNGKSDDKAAKDVTTPGEGAPGHAGGQDDGSGSAPDDGAAPPGEPQPDGNDAAAREDPADASAPQPGPEPTADASVPSTETSASSHVDQLAEAEAGVVQRGIGATRVAARVDAPGDGTAVAQRNAAAAVASAAATAPAVAADPPAPADGGRGSSARDEAPGHSEAREARAVARAEQKEASNVALSIRVDSPGDDGPISQLNEVVATATATTAEAPGRSEQSSETAEAYADASQEEVSNLRVAVRVGSPGDDGDLEQRNTVSAGATATTAGGAGGSATASTVQRNARNTSVQIRVASPGDPGTISQRSTSTESVEAPPAGTSIPRSKGHGPVVSVRRGGADTALVVDLNGSALLLPFTSGVNAGQSEWRWDWAWDGTPVADEPTTWQWSWTAATPGAGRTPSAAPGAVAGALVWSWTWLEDGEERVAWTRRIDLDCGTCAWVWDWRWTLSAPAPPAESDTDAAAEGTSARSDAVVSQEIAAEATAVAAADGGIDQALVQTALEGPGFAGQIGSLQQSARAEAMVAQDGVALAWTPAGPAAQRVVAVAQADVTLEGSIDQDLAQAAAGEAWAGQQAEVVQTASSAAATEQTEIAVEEGSTIEALAAATATATASVRQTLDQQGAGTGARWAGQLTRVGQNARSRTSVAQSGADPLPSRTAEAQAISITLAVVHQTTSQRAEAEATGTQTSRQSVLALQSAVADAVTTDGADTHALASSAAVASAKALAEQIATQFLVDATEQDGTQETTFLQDGTSRSSAAGGIGGLASVVNCATVQQTATQATGGTPAPTAVPDVTAFCTPPPTPPGAPPATPETTVTTELTATAEATIAASGPGTLVSAETRALVLRAPSLSGRPAGTASASASASATTVGDDDPLVPAALAPPLPRVEAGEGEATGHPAAAPAGASSAQEQAVAGASAMTEAASPPTASETAGRRTAPSDHIPTSPEEAPGIPGSASAAGTGGGTAAALSPLPVGIAPPSGWSVQVESAVRRPTSLGGRLETPG